MCTAEGAAVLNVVGSVLKFQDKKEQAATTRVNNTIARNEYNKGYLADVTEIDGNIQDAKDEKTANIVKNKINGTHYRFACVADSDIACFRD